MYDCNKRKVYATLFHCKKVKVEHLIAPQVDIVTTKALMARTKQRRTYLPYTFPVPAIAGTHLQTPRGWRVE